MNGAAKAEMQDTHAQAIRRSERGADAFARAERHSRRVRVLKFVLPLVAVAVSVLFLGYSMLPNLGSGSIDLRSATIEGGNLVMENPTLDGFTDEDLPYTMTAARARQALGSGNGAIALEGITATVPIDEGTQATITAASGAFDRENDRLTLGDGITLRTTSGLVARLRSAEVDIAANDLASDEPVEIETDGMRIEADTFRAADGGRTLVFEDRVRVTIDPAQVRRAQGQQGEEGNADE